MDEYRSLEKSIAEVSNEYENTSEYLEQFKI